MAHYRQITGTYVAFTIKDVYRYRRLTDKAGVFTADNRRQWKITGMSGMR